MPHLETERLSLRPLSLEAMDALIMGQRSHLSRLWDVNVPDTFPGPDYEKILPMVRHRQAEQPLISEWTCVAIHRVDRILIGGSGFEGTGPFTGILSDVKSIEFGYSVIPDYRNQGYATEMVGALVKWASAQPGVPEIIARCTPDNHPSIRVLEKIGMTRTGIEDDHLVWSYRP